MKYVKIAVLVISIINVVCGVCLAGEKMDLKDENERLNYSHGFQFGESLKHQGVEINPEVLLKGMKDANSGVKPLMTPQEISITLSEFKKRTHAAKRIQKQQATEKYRGEGREFLTANAKKPGIVTLPSGLQYKAIREGTGKTPGPHDTVTVHYRGTLIDGTEFDSSYRKNEPGAFRVDGVIRGWTEGLQLMREGAKWQLFIPPDLAYGERGPLADRTLIFDVELISVQSSK